MAGRSTGPVQLDAAEAGEEDAVAEAAGAEVESAAAGHGGGFFGWVGSLLGWGERGAIRYDDTMRGGDPEALHGHATTIDTTFDEKGRVARQGQESHDIAGGSATDRHSVEFSGRAKGDHEILDIHGDLGGTRRSTTAVEDAAGRHLDSVEVGGKVEGDMDRKKGEAVALAGRGTLQVASTQADTAGGTTVTTREGGKLTGGMARDAALDRKAGTTTTRGGLSVTRGAQTVREDEAGRTITAKQADTVGVKADVARGEKPGQGVSASWQRKDSEVVEQVEADGAKRKTTTEHVGRQVEAGYRQGQGASVSFSTGNVHHDEQTLADGTKVASHREDKTALSADARGVGVRHSVSGVGREETRKLDDKTTLTTTQGKVGGTAGARAEKGEDGTRAATAKAEGNATLYEQQVDRTLENGGKASAGWEALSAKGQAEAKANISKDGVKIGGNAGAKATLIGGNAMIEAPVFGWKMLGEEVDVAVTAGVSAGVLAEASGQVDLDISKGDSLGVQMSGGGKAFSGAKAGVEASFGLTLKGGRINVSGALSGTVGLGAGVHTDLLLDAVDGVRFAGVLAMRGTAWLKDAISQAGDWFDQAVDVVQAKIDEYMEAEKAQGGFSGAAATVVDFFGDSVFGLW